MNPADRSTQQHIKLQWLVSVVIKLQAWMSLEQVRVILWLQNCATGNYFFWWHWIILSVCLLWFLPGNFTNKLNAFILLIVVAVAIHGHLSRVYDKSPSKLEAGKLKEQNWGLPMVMQNENHRRENWNHRIGRDLWRSPSPAPLPSRIT